MFVGSMLSVAHSDLLLLHCASCLLQRAIKTVLRGLPLASGATCAYTSPMTDQTKNSEWARRFLDLWERNLVAITDHPLFTQSNMKFPTASPMDKAADQTPPPGVGQTETKRPK